MRIIELPTIWTVLFDIIAWGIIQPGVAWLSLHVPERWIEPERWLYRTRRWEEGGQFWQRLLGVRYWKGLLISAGSVLGGFSLKHIESYEPAYLRRWVLESCRAELCHLAAIAPAALFFFWNKPAVGWLMVAYALVFNLPMVITQRYNRPRVQAELARRAHPPAR